MSLKIIMPNQTLLVNAIIMYLYTDPGIGKSTLAHTADKAVVFDFDKGQHRVSADLRRGAVVPVQQWSDIELMKESDLAGFNTIVADTVGAMLDCIKIHLAKNQENLQRDKNLTIKAQGLANNLFMKTVLSWISYGKDVVFIAHSTEEEAGKDKNRVVRPDLGGKNRNMLYRMADMMGYMHSSTDDEGNNERHIYFNPSANHHAKNSGNLGLKVNDKNGNPVNTGQVFVPDLANNPTFLADLIKQAKDHINTITPEQIAEIKAQEELSNFKQSCTEANYNSDLNQLTESLDREHPYTMSMWHSIQLRGREMKCSFNKEKKRWFEDTPFKGITDAQRDEIQDLLAASSLDVMAFCQSQGIDALIQIEAKNFNDVKAFITNSTQNHLNITEQQRDELQAFIDERGLDVKSVCEHLGLDALTEIEVSKLDAVKAEIDQIAKAGVTV